MKYNSIKIREQKLLLRLALGNFEIDSVMGKQIDRSALLTMDNGGENNLIHKVIVISKLYNCHPYCSGEKSTLESTHRILRRIIKKGRNIDAYSNENIKIVVKFVNSYYSKIFHRT